MRLNALAQLKRAIPAFRWQRCLTLLAGTRGKQNSNDWVLPLSDDPEFIDMMVNAVKAPSYNRHWVVNGSTLTQGGAQLASVATTDSMKLSHLDEFSAIWDELSIKMAPIMIPGDPAAGDDPIKGILYVDPLVWDAIETDTTATGNLRKYKADAMERAKYGNLSRHPLFSGSPILWNGVLIRKMQYGVRHDAGDAVAHVTAANRLSGAETNVTVAAGLSTTHQIARSIFMGAQALAICSGANQSSEETYSLLENRTNFERNLELAGEIMGTEDKLRWALPNADGELEVTDFGVAVIDSVVRKRNV